MPWENGRPPNLRNNVDSLGRLAILAANNVPPTAGLPIAFTGAAGRAPTSRVPRAADNARPSPLFARRRRRRRRGGARPARRGACRAGRAVRGSMYPRGRGAGSAAWGASGARRSNGQAGWRAPLRVYTTCHPPSLRIRAAASQSQCAGPAVGPAAPPHPTGRGGEGGGGHRQLDISPQKAAGGRSWSHKVPPPLPLCGHWLTWPSA